MVVVVVPMMSVHSNDDGDEGECSVHSNDDDVHVVHTIIIINIIRHS